MKPISVALLQSDARTATDLCSSLCHHFHSIHSADTIDALRFIIAKHRVEIAIIDMEMAALSQIEQLRRDFAGTCVVCTHRLADEEMWAAALNAGAVDMCSSRDTISIVTAALRTSPSAVRPAAA